MFTVRVYVQLYIAQQKFQILRDPQLDCTHPSAYKIAFMYINDKALYETTAREWTAKYGIHRIMYLILEN